MERIKAVNYEKFQRYKDRRPPWIKLYREILEKRKIMELPPTAFKLLVCVWLMAAEYDNDIPVADIEWRLRYEVCTDLEHLICAGLVQEVCNTCPLEEKSREEIENIKPGVPPDGGRFQDA